MLFNVFNRERDIYIILFYVRELLPFLYKMNIKIEVEWREGGA